jgi:hypothetical protein
VRDNAEKLCFRTALIILRRQTFQAVTRVPAANLVPRSRTICDIKLSILWSQFRIVPEDNSELHTRRRENLKSHMATVVFLLRAPNRLGGVVVSVLATGPSGRGFKPGQVDGFVLRAIKIRSTPSHVLRYYGTLKIP